MHWIFANTWTVCTFYALMVLPLCSYCYFHYFLFSFLFFLSNFFAVGFKLEKQIACSLQFMNMVTKQPQHYWWDSTVIDNLYLMILTRFLIWILAHDTIQTTWHPFKFSDISEIIATSDRSIECVCILTDWTHLNILFTLSCCMIYTWFSHT